MPRQIEADITEALEDGGLTTSEVAVATQAPRGTIESALRRMHFRGELTRNPQSLKWYLTPPKVEAPETPVWDGPTLPTLEAPKLPPLAELHSRSAQVALRLAELELVYAELQEQIREHGAPQHRTSDPGTRTAPPA